MLLGLLLCQWGVAIALSVRCCWGCCFASEARLRRLLCQWGVAEVVALSMKCSGDGCFGSVFCLGGCFAREVLLTMCCFASIMLLRLVVALSVNCSWCWHYWGCCLLSEVLPRLLLYQGQAVTYIASLVSCLLHSKLNLKEMFWVLYFVWRTAEGLKFVLGLHISNWTLLMVPMWCGISWLQVLVVLIRLHDSNWTLPIHCNVMWYVFPGIKF